MILQTIAIPPISTTRLPFRYSAREGRQPAKRSRLKRAGQVMDFPALPCDADLNDIKTTETTVEMSLPQEPARRLDDFLLFPVIDGGRWPTEAPRAPRGRRSRRARARRSLSASCTRLEAQANRARHASPRPSRLSSGFRPRRCYRYSEIGQARQRPTAIRATANYPTASPAAPPSRAGIRFH